MLEQGTDSLATIMSQALTREGGEAGRPLPASQGTLATGPGMARCRSENTGARYRMPAPVSIRPEVKKPEQSIEDFVRYFERVMRANRWDDETAGVVFPALLPSGERILDDISEESLGTFSGIRAAIEERQRPFREANLQVLMNAEFDVDSETVSEYQGRIANLVECTYSKITHDLQRQLTRDFFLQGLPPSLRDAVLTRLLTTLEETVNVAKMVLSMKKDEFVSLAGKQEERFRGNPERTGVALQRQQSQRQDRSLGIRGQVIWYECGGKGHIRRQCPSVKRPCVNTCNETEQENEN